MLLFLKGLLIGFAKIIPGVSGAMLLVNFNIYERLINAITNFFTNWKENIRFLLILGSGLLMAIVFGSGIVLFLLTNYKFLTMVFFIGLIIGGTYNFSRRIVLNRVNIFVILIIILLFTLLIFVSKNGNYVLRGSFFDNLVLFMGGIIEIFASIVPGVSGTSLLMMAGIYDLVLVLIANSFNVIYVVNNIWLYISFFLGMMLSFIINIYLISYLFRKYRDVTYAAIFGLSIASIISMGLIVVKIKITIMEFILGIMLLTIGLLVSSIMDK